MSVTLDEPNIGLTLERNAGGNTFMHETAEIKEEAQYCNRTQDHQVTILRNVLALWKGVALKRPELKGNNIYLCEPGHEDSALRQVWEKTLFSSD